MASEQNFVYDSAASDEAAGRMYAEISAAVKRGLLGLGIDAVFEDSHGVFAVRVADERNLGTAYLEIRDCSMRMRIVLFEETTETTEPAASAFATTSPAVRDPAPRRLRSASG